MRRLAAFLIPMLALACSESGEPVGAIEKLVFSAIPDQDETRLREKYAPVAAYLSTQVGIPVEYLHATSYADAVEHFKNGDVQLAWFGGLSGVQARAAVDGARAIAMGEADAAYVSYFIAHKDSGLGPGESFPHGIAGKKFTFGSAQSTSGRLMPEHFIRDATGQSPTEFLGVEALHFSVSHDKTAELVESGQFDAGALSFNVYDRRVEEGETDPNTCRVIWTTPPYPDYNFTVHPSVSDELVEKLQRAILEMTDEDLLAAFPRRKFIEANNEDFASIEELAVELGFLR